MLSFSSCRSDRAKKQWYFSTIALVAISFWCGSTFANDWATLFDGNSLDGWKASHDNTQFALADGVIVGTSSSQTQFLHTVETYGDFELELEVKLHDTDLNSGVQIRTSLTRKNAKGQPRESIHGPQVDIGKSPGRSDHIFNQGNPLINIEERLLGRTGCDGDNDPPEHPGRALNNFSMSVCQWIESSRIHHT